MRTLVWFRGEDMRVADHGAPAAGRRFMHPLWQAPAHVLEQAGVRLGRNYPAPLVEREAARRELLSTAQRHLQRRRGGAKA